MKRFLNFGWYSAHGGSLPRFPSPSLSPARCRMITTIGGSSGERGVSEAEVPVQAEATLLPIKAHTLEATSLSETPAPVQVVEGCEKIGYPSVEPSGKAESGLKPKSSRLISARKPFVVQGSQPNGSIALAKRIRAVDSASFDEARWQVSKSVPGLIGDWLESALQNPNLKEPSPWLFGPRQYPEATEAFLCDYLERGAVGVRSELSGKAQALADRLQLVLGDGTICLAPIYDSILHSKDFTAKTPLGKHIFAAFRAAAKGRDTDSGDHFKKFIASALSARLELTKMRMEAHPGVHFTLQSLFGLIEGDKVWTMHSNVNPKASSLSGAGQGPNTPFYKTIVVPLTTPETAQYFLGTLFYNIFPIPVPNEFWFSTTGTHDYLTSEAVFKLLHGVTSDPAPKADEAEEKRRKLRDRASDASPEVVAFARRLIASLCPPTTQFHLDERLPLGRLCDAIVEASKHVPANDFSLTLTRLIAEWRCNPPSSLTQAPPASGATRIPAQPHPSRVTLPTRHRWSSCSFLQIPCFTAELSRPADSDVTPSSRDCASVDAFMRLQFATDSTGNSNTTEKGSVVHVAIQVNDANALDGAAWTEAWQTIEEECICPPQDIFASHTDSALRIIVIVSRSDVELFLQQQRNKKGGSGKTSVRGVEAIDKMVPKNS
jgi:hypothetical protein